MKPNFALWAALPLLAAPLLAQDVSSGRVVVPARDSSHARKVDVNTMNERIVIKVHSGREVIVDTEPAESRRTARRQDPVPPGMHRIDLPQGLSVEEADNVVTIRSQPPGHGTLVVSVPAETALKLRSLNGGIEVDGVRGDIDLSSHNGKVTLNHVSGSVLANTMNGAIKASLDSVDATKPLSFTSMNGSIDVSLPADFKANVKLRTDHGQIYSDFDLRLGGGVITEKNNSSEGKFRVRLDRTITGTVNGGGTDATFKTYNGSIYLRKRS